MLKRLAAASVLTVAAGGVLVSAAPAMADTRRNQDPQIYDNSNNVLVNCPDGSRSNPRGSSYQGSGDDFRSEFREMFRGMEFLFPAVFDGSDDSDRGRVSRSASSGCKQVNYIVNQDR
ncbi:hypothetical protein SAMN04489712_10998 [Thermomonospora echinospora]|uniref:Secreted protein n=1 Tax=Thermomonospora echinospora TaxID=1992 RepID=A0A1H6C9J3_9ACTN|nr:hypothetical protein [Thermomonospora echinospora]SEG69578.1 hypothetical protein SAMN04489712_10998 [Thermomonospora echinospora]